MVKYYTCDENLSYTDYIWSYREDDEYQLVIHLVNETQKTFTPYNVGYVSPTTQKHLEKILIKKGYKKV